MRMHYAVAGRLLLLLDTISRPGIIPVLPPPPPQVGFSYPVVPKGKARIRVQISAAHEREHLDAAISAFTDVGRDLGVIR